MVVVLAEPEEEDVFFKNGLLLPLDDGVAEAFEGLLEDVVVVVLFFRKGLLLPLADPELPLVPFKNGLLPPDEVVGFAPLFKKGFDPLLAVVDGLLVLAFFKNGLDILSAFFFLFLFL